MAEHQFTWLPPHAVRLLLGLLLHNPVLGFVCVYCALPTPVSMSQSRPLSSKPDSGTFWMFLFALQALNLLMDTDSWVFTREIRTGSFSKGYFRDLWWSCDTGLLPCDRKTMAWTCLALTPALWHHLQAHEKEDFSTSLQRAAVLCLLRRGSGKVQPLSQQKC